MKPYLLILAGGLGTRLQSVVPNCPKPMAIVGDKPFLVRLLDDIIDQDIDCEIFVSVGYLGNQIVDYFQDCYKGRNIRYVVETEPLGTGGAIKKFVDEFGIKEPFFVKNGDTFTDANLTEMHQKFQKVECNVMISVVRMPDATRYGCVTVQDDDYKNNLMKVTGFEPKGIKNGPALINSGTYLIKPECVLANKRDIFSFEEEVLQNASNDICVTACRTGNRFLDIGIPADYEKAHKFFNK